MWSENSSQWTILEPLCYSSFVFATLVYGVIGYKFCWLLPHSRSSSWTRISWDTNWARITYTIRFRSMILSVVQHSIIWYKTWSIQGWSTWLGQVWPPIICLHILHMQFLLLLVFSRSIWMLMILMVAWYFEIFQVEDLVRSTWIHHFAAVHFRAPFHSDYGRHQSLFRLVESYF